MIKDTGVSAFFKGGVVIQTDLHLATVGTIVQHYLERERDEERERESEREKERER